MPLEDGNYISDLDPNNPLGLDGKSQGDDHLRLIKKTITQTFPNIDGPVTLTQGEINGLQSSIDANTASIDAINTAQGNQDTRMDGIDADIAQNATDIAAVDTKYDTALDNRVEVFTGTGAPSGAIGKDGDVYIEKP